MILDDHFERVLIISLPGAELRAERALQELREKKLSLKAVVTRAVDGKICAPSDWWQAGAGAWGCMQSHYRAVQDALMDGVDSLLVIEDDCIWQDDANRMASEFLAEVPEDWGQIYFGGQHRSKHRPSPITGKPSVLKCHSVHRTHAYAIHKRIMPQFLKHIIYAPDYLDANSESKPKDQRFKSHVDHQLERAHRRGDWPVYAPSWWLAGQGENISYINGRHQRENWWHPATEEASRRMPLVIADCEPVPDEMRCLHFGKTLHPEDPTIDTGVRSSATPESLIRVMEMISREAASYQVFPAFREWDKRPEMTEWLTKGWLGPVWRLSDERDLQSLRNFPGSKLLAHPWFNPPQILCTPQS